MEDKMLYYLCSKTEKERLEYLTARSRLFTMYVKYKCSDCFDEFIKIDNFTNEEERMLFFIKEFDKYYPEGFMDSLKVDGNGVENYIEIPEGSYYLIKKSIDVIKKHLGI